MGTEIERKFLVTDDRWRAASDGWPARFRQGYLFAEGGRNARVRLSTGRDGAHAWVTIKGVRSGIARYEFEYEIPVEDAEIMLDTLCMPVVIDKTRSYVAFGGETWEVDVFAGANAGLVLAELELDDAAKTFARPPWIGAEVSEDARYYNSALARHPYSTWPRQGAHPAGEK